jgi:tRNA threonylcarbamoyl adenosine modification protein YeaZ
MKILAFEFSGPQRSVAVRKMHQQGSVLGESEAVEAGGRSIRPFALTEQVLSEVQVEREEIDVIAVGLGPGSYTGIRMAISIAQGWQLGRDVRLLGISSVEAIVAGAYAQGMRGVVGVVIDAQRGEFYLANYELGNEGWTGVRPLRLTSRGEVDELAGGGATLLGPEVDRWFNANRRVVHPRASILAKLASERADFVAGQDLEPIYLRPTTFVKAPPPRRA